MSRILARLRALKSEEVITVEDFDKRFLARVDSPVTPAGPTAKCELIWKAIEKAASLRIHSTQQSNGGAAYHHELRIIKGVVVARDLLKVALCAASSSFPES